ncbi:unnamed protein product [Phytophthora lilii]|uniref:Unnamed protein product n=1 Tax=Phytophthora lilii TaxID=2077276 RepID=A0A9W6XPA6_9STRA|nr:unnamed protein product [Phytophthora lilii]
MMSLTVSTVARTPASFFRAEQKLLRVEEVQAHRCNSAMLISSSAVDMPADMVDIADLVLETDNITLDSDNAHPAQRHRSGYGRWKPPELNEPVVATPSRRSTLQASNQPRPSRSQIVITEVATFHGVFGVLGVPMIIAFVLSAIWTFMLAYIQVHATDMANLTMNTTNFDDGEFWLLPRPNNAIVISSTIMLSLFGIVYTGLVIMMAVCYRVGHKEIMPTEKKIDVEIIKISDAKVESNEPKNNMFWGYVTRMKCNIPRDIRDHYYVSFASRQIKNSSKANIAGLCRLPS